MDHNTPTTRELALLVLSDEWAHDFGPDEIRSAVQRTFDKLNAHLSVRLGSGGYRALLTRAVTLAAADIPSLASVSVSDDGTVDGLQIMNRAEAVSEGCTAILAHLIELLDTFIARELTLRVLHNLWPNATRIDGDGAQGESK